MNNKNVKFLTWDEDNEPDPPKKPSELYKSGELYASFKIYQNFTVGLSTYFQLEAFKHLCISNKLIPNISLERSWMTNAKVRPYIKEKSYLKKSYKFIKNNETYLLQISIEEDSYFTLTFHDEKFMHNILQKMGLQILTKGPKKFSSSRKALHEVYSVEFKKIKEYLILSIYKY